MAGGGGGQPHLRQNSSLSSPSRTNPYQPDRWCSWARSGVAAFIQYGREIRTSPRRQTLVPRPRLAGSGGFTLVRTPGQRGARVFCNYAALVTAWSRGAAGHPPHICFTSRYQMSWLSAQKPWEKTMNSQPLKEQFALEWKNNSLVSDNKKDHIHFSSQPCGYAKISSTSPIKYIAYFKRLWVSFLVVWQPYKMWNTRICFNCPAVEWGLRKVIF